MKTLTGLFIILSCMLAYSQPGLVASGNFEHFSAASKTISAEQKKLTPDKFMNHPDLGIYPADGPACADCFEDISRRTETSRFFIQRNTNGKVFYQQNASAPLNYKDENGWWRAIDTRLEKKAGNIFTADHQPSPLSVDLKNNLIRINNGGTELILSHPVLIWKKKSGEEEIYGTPDYSHFTAGDDGIKISNVYPGVDLVYAVKRFQIESLFIINNKIKNVKGDLITRQVINKNEKLSFNEEQSTTKNIPREIYIKDNNGVVYYTIEKGIVFDSNVNPSIENINSGVSAENSFDFILPEYWLNDPVRKFPVTIDPSVITNNTLAVSGIAGTKFSPVCWMNGCDYFLNVTTPANCLIDSIFQSFSFTSTGICTGLDGGYSLDFMGCTAPSASPGVYTTGLNLPMITFNANNKYVPEFTSCIPAAQCAAQNFMFTMHFFRCNHDPDVNCTSNCVRAQQPWIMSVKGEYVEIPNGGITPPQNICAGNNATLVVTPRYGVQPYSFSWMPSAVNNDTLLITPAANQSYTVTVTDACGITASASTTVSLITNDNPGFSITPNPACVNSNVTLTGNGSAPATAYDWSLPGSSAAGNMINDQQSPVVSYSVGGNYPVTLKYKTGTCEFDSTININVTSSAAPTVSITAQPAGTVCQNNTVHFQSMSTNGGATPNFNWLVNGTSVQNGNSDSLVATTLNNGDIVQCILTSSSSCATVATDTASLFIAVGNALTPSVRITPDTAVCPGSSVTFKTVNVNDGTAPSYQWYVNGNAVAGETNPQFSHLIISPDTIISVEISSSLSCVTTALAHDTSIASILQNVAPLVTINAAPSGTVCNGDIVDYNAATVNGGSAPQYQWYINGILNGDADSVLSITPADGDSISVNLISSLTCVTTPADDNYTIASVSPAVSPAVNILVSPSAVVCLNNNVTFTAHGVNAGSNPFFAWNVNGNATGVTDSIFSSSTLNDNDNVEVTITSSLTCAPVNYDRDSITISVLNNVTPSVTISSTTNAVCERDPVQFVALTTDAGINPSVEWYENGVSTGINNDTLVLTTLMNGDTVSTVITSGLACVTSPTATSAPYISTLRPYVDPEINILSSPADTICAGQQLNISSSTLNGGMNPVYRWYVNGVATPVTSSDFISQQLENGDIVQAILLSDESCLNKLRDTSNFIRVLQHPALSAQLSTSNAACPGLPVVINLIAGGGNGGPYNTTWSNGARDTNSIIIYPDTSIIIHVAVNDNCTTSPGMDSLLVSVLNGPHSDYSYENPSPGSFENNIQFTNQSVNAASWLWIFPDSNSTSMEFNPVHQFPGEGTYPVTLVTQSVNGCVDSVNYFVLVQEKIAVYYPTSFTPNGDGRNELFQPIGASLDKYDMTIWNRWGEKIFDGNELTPWDGSIRASGKIAPEGVYVFQISLKGERFEKKIVTGRVTLIR